MIPIGRIIARLVLPLMAGLILAGCAGGQSHSLLDVAAAGQDEIAATHRILIATTRGKAQDRAEVFDGSRATALSFARIDVTVPKVHRLGVLEKPGNGQRRDAAKHFAAREIAVFDGEAGFRAALRERIAKTGGRAMVFVHGYRTPFDGSVYRAAQIVHDSGYLGTPVLFSWASAGRTVEYIYDNNSATVARDGLEKTLRVLREAGARRIDIVAHSMGNWLMMETLRQFAIAHDRDLGDSLGDVVLASPDIDLDVFKSQLRRIGRPDRPFFVLVSRDDRALRVSGLIAGNQPRVGDYGNDADLASLGVIVVDVSSMSSGDRLNHARFADNPVLVQLLGQRLNEDDDLNSGDQLSRHVERLVQGLGQTIGSAAQIVVTTPLQAFSVAVGQ